METIDVYFYEDIFDCYAHITIHASSLEEFNFCLDEQSEAIINKAKEEGIEIAGARYNLPDAWQETKRRKR